MWPSPSISAYRIISSTYSSVSFYPKLVITCRSYAAEISPLPSRSNTLKASINYYYVSVSFIFLYGWERTWPSRRGILGNLWFHCRRRRLRWSYLEVLLRLDFVRGISWQFLIPKWGVGYFGGDGAVSILVEQGKGLFEFSNLLFVELISHIWN